MHLPHGREGEKEREKKTTSTYTYIQHEKPGGAVVE